MDRAKIVKSIILNLQTIDFNNKRGSMRQLASAVDLIEAIAEDMQEVGSEESTGLCKHHKDDVIDIGTMAEPKRRQCMKCNETFTEQ